MALSTPTDWTLRGPEGSTVDVGALRFTGTLKGPLEFEAGPDARTGLTALLTGISRFLNDPLL